ncbi:MAG: NAD(+) synthase [Candidatus Odinarchaeum yellowstonii]|uniref:NH(3)-dependent NAD(+) synthetase n=1 Tax=Odinarchaeota yellowstonii (strain LCB_4) TaxID=1841599 RepID=A0AAF0D332_ODILC|nr:MAG: NAD(+) synthase [Candidatus Odinarchaeum yellowstonii]
MNEDEIIAKIVNWLIKQIEKTGMKGFTLGLSGGLDSAVTAALCKRTGYHTLGLIMPCHSPPETVENALKFAEKISLDYKIIDLTELYDRLLQLYKTHLQPTNLNAEANIKPRLRMTTLYYVANNLSFLVVGTGNYTELKLGYFTKYGDGGVDLLPLGDLVKGEVRRIARVLEIPKEIINRAPSADLYEGQTDEGELGVKYEILDRIVRGDFYNIPVETVDKIMNRIKNNTHKRRMPPICKIH